MSSGPRGALLWEYSPPRAHPILYAGLLVFGFVFMTGSLENLARENVGRLYAIYAAPIIGTALIMVALMPSSTRIYENGIAPARSLIMRWHQPFVAWTDLAAVYPHSYDVTGAFVSPFASSDGKVTQTGLGLEWPDGTSETVKFTPTRFSMTSRRSRGFREAYALVVDSFQKMGRPMVAAANQYTSEERAAMMAAARAPFLPFFAIVFLFASAAPIVWILLRLHVPVPVALGIGLLAPLGTSLRSYVKSRERNRILNALAKQTEFERIRSGGAPVLALAPDEVPA